MEPTKHQYDYDSATIHGFLVRNGLEGEYRLNIEANHATLAGHSFHHEVAYAAANGMLGCIDANRGDPQNGWDTDQFPNSVEDLALPLYEILQGGRPRAPAASTSTPSSAARASTARTCSTPTSAGSTRSPGRCWSRRTSSSAGRCSTRVEARYAGLGRRRSGTAILDGTRVARVARGEGRGGRDRPAPGLGAPGASWRTSSTTRIWSRRRDPMAFVLGIDASTTATKAVLVDEAGRVAGIARGRVRVRAAAPAVERAGPAPVVGRRGGRDPAAAGRRPATDPADVVAVGLTGQMHGLVLLDAAGEVLRPAILWNDQRTAAECDAIRAAVGKERLVEITGNDALTGFTAPKLAWVRDHEPDVWARVAHVLLPKDYVRLALTGELRAWTRRTAPGPSCSTSRPATGRR